MPKTIEEKGIQNKELSLFAAFAAFILCIFFGANAVAIKMTFWGIGIFTSPAIRFTLASTAILTWAILSGKSIAIKRDQIRHYIILALFFSSQFFVYYWGINRTHASRGMLIANLQPFFVLFMSHFLIPGDSITRRKLTGIALGFIGIVFVFAERSTGSSQYLIGDLGVLASTAIWACNIIYIKRIIHKFDSFLLILYPMLFSLPAFWTSSILFDSQKFFNLSPAVIGSLIYQSFITASFGLVIWSSMLQRYGAVALHSFIFILPITGVTLGGLILKEPITPKIYGALLLIVIGTIVVNWRGVGKSVKLLKKENK